MEEMHTNAVVESMGPPSPCRSRRLSRVLRLGRIIASSTRPPDYRELARLTGVSRRTLFRDLSLLRSAGIESPFIKNRGDFRIRPTGVLLGQRLTLREVAATLELLERNRPPKPNSTYDNTLWEAKHKIIFALREECSAVAEELDAMISAFHRE